MKKVLVTILALIGTVISVSAQEVEAKIKIPEGYQGFLEQGTRYHFWGDETSSVDVSTTHGFYFNGHTYAGIGIGVSAGRQHTLVPVYTSIKHVFYNDRYISPVGQVRLGSYLGDDFGTYADLAVGVRFATKRDFALTISAAVSYFEPFKEEVWNWESSTTESETVDFSGASLRFGIEW